MKPQYRLFFELQREPFGADIALGHIRWRLIFLGQLHLNCSRVLVWGKRAVRIRR
jgi:hypothetical protein